MNVPDARVILHWGFGSFMQTYWQDVGRAGRDNLTSFAIAYVHSRDIT